MRCARLPGTDNRARTDDPSSAGNDLDSGMKMAGEFCARFIGPCAVTQYKTADFELTYGRPAGKRFHLFVVIAGNPYPVDRTGQGMEHSLRIGFQPSGAIAVMEIVA